MEKKNFNTKLHEVCADNELRPLMSCIHFAGSFAYASDAKIAIKQALSFHTIENPECLDGKSLHKDSYIAIMKFDKAVADDTGIACSDADGRIAFFEYFNRKDELAPDIETIIKACDGGYKAIEFIGLDPTLVTRLSKAMVSVDGSFQFQFRGVDGAVRVECPGIQDQVGIIMPIQLGGIIEFGKEEK